MLLPRRFVTAALAVPLAVAGRAAESTVSVESLRQVQEVIGLDFPPAALERIAGSVRRQREMFLALRETPLPNHVPPALLFDPVPPGFAFSTEVRSPVWSAPERTRLPERREELAFYSVAELGALLRTRQISSEELTRFFLERLRRYGPVLNCVVSLTEERALASARRADAEIASGHYRGPLHGVPYGAKDLLAAKGYPTTWGSAAFRDQVFTRDATVIRRLEAAGAVLVAKLTTGELAWDDLWFGGQTRNPWNPAQGSSGSSAGPGAATAAGLVPFALGSETWGSIVSPSTRCGVTGLRPTFGRVSRCGAMTLSWSMDKLGPMARSAEDCALVFDAIRGPDGCDAAVRDLPFNYTPQVDLAQLRIGFLKEDFARDKRQRANNEASLALLRRLGAKLVPVKLPTELPVDALSLILTVEEGAAFDELTRSGGVKAFVRARQADWFRAARFIPAVEYLQANRVRELLIREMADLMAEVDVIVAPSRAGSSGLISNLTGHPCVVLPDGFDAAGRPTSLCLIGRLYDEARLLAVAKALQDAAGFHRKHPDLSRLVTRVRVPRLDGEVSLDGRLDEPAWNAAAALHLEHNDGSGAAWEDTTVRLWYDAEALYLGWTCRDADIQATFTERDSRFWEEEVAEFFITPGALTNYFELQWNPLGGVFDAVIANDLGPDGISQGFEGDWSFTAAGMRSAARVEGTVGNARDTDQLWQVEVRVPFADLGVEPPRPGDVWRGNCYRFNRGRGRPEELQAWAPTRLPSFHQPARFGYFEFGEPKPMDRGSGH